VLLTLTVVLTHPQNVVLAQGMKEASSCLLRLQIDHQLNFASEAHVFSALQSYFLYTKPATHSSRKISSSCINSRRRGHFCIDRHKKATNIGFADSRVERVSLEDLWTQASQSQQRCVFAVIWPARVARITPGIRSTKTSQQSNTPECGIEKVAAAEFRD